MKKCIADRKSMAMSKDGKLHESIDCMPSEISIVVFNIYNQSDIVWPSNIYLKKENGDVEFEDLDLCLSVLPSTSQKIEFTIIAPLVEGKHHLILRFYDRNTSVSFGRKLTLLINVMPMRLEEYSIVIPVSYKSPIQSQAESKEKISITGKV